MHTLKPDWGTVTKEGIKLTQRSWIRYRDAWVIFGAIHCPAISLWTLKTMFTLDRINQLKEISGEIE